MADLTPWFHRIERPEAGAVDALLDRLARLQAGDAHRPHGHEERVSFAFRGVPSASWHLEPTVLFNCRVAHDEAGLARERRMVEEFRERAWRFLSSTERVYLNADAEWGTSRLRQPRISWNDQSVWGALAVARHYGVPTRLLDWTWNGLAALFFAASNQEDEDGAVWWFSQTHLERELNADDQRLWRDWNVPTREATRERAIERRAFDLTATPWVCKTHQYPPFRRMDAQRGFFTACGRLDMSHNTAIDALGGDLPRGRLLIPKNQKSLILDRLESLAVWAPALDYPRADDIGGQIYRANTAGDPPCRCMGVHDP